jgi:putative lipoic acid-binding regulatory protein
MTNDCEKLIDYPSAFPIKIMGLTHDTFIPTVVRLVTEHDVKFHMGKLETRLSSKGNYTSLTVTVHATSREQLDNLYRALSSHPMTKMVL